MRAEIIKNDKSSDPDPSDKHTELIPLDQRFQTNSNPPEWKKLLRESVSSSELADRFGLDKSVLGKVCHQYPARVNPYYLSLIKEKDDPLYLQAIPQLIELEDTLCEEDPLHEEPENQARENVPSLLTHRYPDRVLFRISNECAMYCRFCTRKRKVGDVKKQPIKAQIQNALDYIKQNEEIVDVILSGGDPLILDDKPLERILSSVYDIISTRENGVIRIGTRMPCVLPQRITPELVEMLKQYHPLFINTHFNHPAEITEESKKACDLMTNAGIHIGNQTVMLKGVNDDVETMTKLMKGLVHMRVKPYYLYQCDPVRGAGHFRTRVEKTIEIYDGLCGHIGGMNVPYVVIDAPGGGGKVRIPSGIVRMNDNEVVVKNYQGKEFVYPQPK